MISLGDINFSLGADTAQLKKSVSQLKQFGKAVDQAAASATKGTSSTVSALQKQERAITNALQKVQNLTASMRRVKGSERYIQSANNSFNQLSKTLSRGKVSALEYQRAMTRFNATLGSSRRAFSDYAAHARKAQKSNLALIHSFENMSTASVLVAGPLSGLGARLTAFTAVTKRGGLAIAALVGAFAIATAAITKFGSAIVEAGTQVRQFDAMFTAVTGSISESNKEFTKAIRIARDVGARIEGLVPAYAKFMAATEQTVLRGAQTEKIFRTVAAAATKLNLDIETTQGIFKALEQIISKGQVAAEELRGQLGDRLPGAFQIAARAMGVSTKELNRMLKAGEILAVDFLPKFAAALAQTFNIDSKPIDTYAAAVSNLSNAWFQFRAEADRQLGITESLFGFYKRLTSTIDHLRENFAELTTVVIATSGALVGLAAPATVNGLITLAGLIKKVTLAVVALNTAVLANPLGRLVQILLRIALAVTGAALALVTFARNIKTSSDGITTFGDYFDAVMMDIKPVTSAVASFVSDTWFNTWDGIKTVVADVWSVVGGIIKTSINEFLNLIVALGKSIKIIFSSIPYVVAEAAIDAMNSLLRIMEDAFNRLPFADSDFGEITNFARGAGEDAGAAFAEAFANKTDFVGIASNAITTYLETVQRRARFLSTVREALERTPNDSDNRGGNILPEDNESGTDTKALKALEKLQNALRSTQKEIDRTRATILAMQEGEAALNRLNEVFAREDRVQGFVDRMLKAGVAMDVAKAKAAELYELLESKDNLIRQQEALKSLQDIFTDTFDQIGSAIVDSIFEGKDAFESLKDIAKNVAKDILQTFLQLALLNPLKNLLFGSDLPVLFGPGGAFGGGGGGGGLGSVLGGLFPGLNKSSGTPAPNIQFNQPVLTEATKEAVKIAGGAARSVPSVPSIPGAKVNLAGAKGLNPAFQEALDNMFAGAKAAGHNLEVSSGFRSIARQRTLFNNAVKKYGSVAAARKWVAPPGGSNHNYGIAADLANNGQWLNPAKYPDTAAAAAWVKQNAPDYGLHVPMKHEPWHIEPMGPNGERLYGSRGPVDLSRLAQGQRLGAPTAPLTSAPLDPLQVPTQPEALNPSQFDDTFNQVKENFNELQSSLDDYILKQKDVTDSMGDLGDSVQDIPQDLTKLGGKVTESIPDIGGGLGNVAETLNDGAGDLASSIQKLLGSISGSLGGLGGGVGGGIGGLLGFRKGGVFGPTKYAAKGMLIKKPTRMMSSDGPVLGGEAGTEAIMPLARDSSGNLGVNAQGLEADKVGRLSNSTTVNVYAPDGSAVEQRKRQDASGKEVVDIIIKQAENNIISQIAKGGSSVNKAIEGRYNLRPSAGLQRN